MGQDTFAKMYGVHTNPSQRGVNSFSGCLLCQRNTPSECATLARSRGKKARKARYTGVFGTIKAPVAPRQSDYLEGQTPLWAREISPGRGVEPPPVIPAAEMVWWGARKGRRRTMGCSREVSPTTE